MKRYFIRKYKFEGEKEWYNPFWAAVISMTIVAIFLMGFYNYKSTQIYKDVNSKEAKAVIETVGFLANYVKDKQATLQYNGRAAATADPHFPLGLSNSIQTLIDKMMDSDKTIQQTLFYHGPNLIAGRVPQRMDITRQAVYSRHFQIGKQSMEDRQTIVEDTMNTEIKRYIKATRFRQKHDIVMVNKIGRSSFTGMARVGRLGFFLLLLVAFIIVAYFCARTIKKDNIKLFVMIGLFLTFSISSLIISFNFSKGDYLITSEKVASTYAKYTQLLRDRLSEDYGATLNPAEINKLVHSFNLGLYSEEAAGFVFQMPDKINLPNASIKNVVSANVGFLIAGWIIGFLFGGFILLKFILKRGFERFINTLFNFSTAYLFIFPGILGMLLLVFIPIVFTIILGFTSLPKYFTEINIGRHFIAFANFGEILGVFNLSSPRNFYYTLGFTLLFTVVAVIIQVSLGILIAVILNEREVSFKGFYQVIFMLPWIIPTYISGLVWNYFFSGRGVIDQLRTVLSEGAYVVAGSNLLLGSSGPMFDAGYFNDPVGGFFIVSCAAAWYAFPFIMLVTLSALQTIPKSVFEAALIDGANWFQTLFKIVLPMIRPTVLPSVLLSTIWTFNNFNMVYLVTGGNDRFDILITRIYDFVNVPPEIAQQYGWTYGYASAYSALIFLILLLFIFIFVRGTNMTEKSF